MQDTWIQEAEARNPPLKCYVNLNHSSRGTWGSLSMMLLGSPEHHRGALAVSRKPNLCEARWLLFGQDPVSPMQVHYRG